MDEAKTTLADINILPEVLDCITTDIHIDQVKLLKVITRIRHDATAELVSACHQLLDAPHQEHFIVRLNEEEWAGLSAIKAVLEKIERGD